MKVQDIAQLLDQLAPLEIAADFDNTGLLVGDPDASVEKILVAHDALPEVVLEAQRLGCSLIVAFHPIIFTGLTHINPNDYVGKAVTLAIAHKIAIYSMHTALDQVIHGVNAPLGEALGLTETEVLAPTGVHPIHGSIGFGQIGTLPQALSEIDFLALVKRQLGTPMVKHSDLTHRTIRRVAVLGGSGASGIHAAKAHGADALVTGDLKYHDYFKAEGKILLIDAGHYETEQFTKKLIVDFLKKKIPNFAIILSDTITNPIKYY